MTIARALHAPAALHRIGRTSLLTLAVLAALLASPAEAPRER